MSLRRVFLALGLASFLALPLSAQTGLRDLVTDFLRTGITLAPPPPGAAVSHVAHFIDVSSQQFLALRQFNSELATQLSSFPLASSAGGFTYRFDPAVGFTRATDSFGPIYAERADTIGKGKLNLGINFSHFSFDRIDQLSLRDGDLKLVFQHRDVPSYVKGDVITADVSLKVNTDITAFVLTYGISDRFDVGAAIPVVRAEVSARTHATIQRLATGATPVGLTIHRFQDGSSSASFQTSGSATGVGDVVLRGKFEFVKGSTGGGLAFLADVRLPTGEERDLLGTGATQAKASLIGSVHLGKFSPHFNGGYTWSTKPPDDRTSADRQAGVPRPKIPEEISYTAGFDWAVHPRVTFVVDVLGRTFRKTQIVSVQPQTFTAVTGDNLGGDCKCEPEGQVPPQTVTATFDRLTTARGNSNTLLGSIGFKVNPFGNLLITANALFSLNRRGLQENLAPLVAVDYSF